MDKRVEYLKPFKLEWNSLDMSVIAGSGQTFTFETDPIYQLGMCSKTKKVWGVESRDKFCIISEEDDKDYTLWAVDREVLYWQVYFGCGVPYPFYLESYEKGDNEFIRKCAKFSKGLVILKQDPWEMIVTFIISQRKSIPSIKTALRKLKCWYGDLTGVFPRENYYISYNIFPSARKIARLGSEDVLREKVGIGYRAPYLLDAAEWYIENKQALFDCRSSEERKSMLMQVSGIGPKVASCISLFGFNDFDAFPVDVWIQRVLVRGDFSMEDVKKYPCPGFLQQVIFNYVIHHKNEFV